MPHAGIQRGDRGSRPLPPENHKNLGCPCDTGLDPLKNHKATKPAFNVEPSSARQQNVISMCFAGGPMVTCL